MAKVVIYDAIDPLGVAILKARKGLSIVTVEAKDRAGLMSALADADALILRYYPIGKPEIDGAPKLKIIQRHGVGYDRVDVAAASARGIPVTTVGEANSVTVAELALYFMLAAARQGSASDRAVRDGAWPARETIPQIELFEKSVLIIGFGRIGSRVAPRCQAFGMKVYVYDPYVSDNVISARGCVPVKDYRAVLPEMDFVTVHVPLTEETRNMIDAAALARMKRSAVLVNTARGPVTDNEAVAAALDSGRLFAAGFDVFEPEPPGTNHPLVKSARTVLTPHSAALTPECHKRTSQRCAQNVLDVLDRRLDPAYVVNPEVLRR